MAKTEWFRRTQWTANDRVEFLTRVKRARGQFHKAQYLRIQALHLANDANPPLYEPALELLDQLLAECPEPMELASAHAQRAKCLSALGRDAEAITAYRSALATEGALPNVRILAYLEFSELVLALEREDLYEEALTLVAARWHGEMFPNIRHRATLAAAFLCERMGNSTDAKAYAERALEEAVRLESPFRFHRKLGLVGTIDDNVHARLQRLAGRCA